MSTIAPIGGSAYTPPSPPAANAANTSSTVSGATDNTANNNAVNGGTPLPPVQAATAPGTGQKVNVIA